MLNVLYLRLNFSKNILILKNTHGQKKKKKGVLNVERKLDKRGNNSREIKNFYWKRDVKLNSIKAEYYGMKKLEEISNFINLCYEYLYLSYGFYWLLKYWEYEADIY